MSRPIDYHHIFANGIHPLTRTLLVHGAVNRDLAQQVIAGLHALDSDSNAPITIKLNSPGGEVYQGLAIYDAIRECRSRVVIIGYGEIASMGVAILQAGDERLLTPHASLMIHEGQPGHGYPNDYPNAEAYLKEVKRARDVVSEIIAARLKITVAQYNRRFKTDTYYSAPEAVAHNLADRIRG